MRYPKLTFSLLPCESNFGLFLCRSQMFQLSHFYGFIGCLYYYLTTNFVDNHGQNVDSTFFEWYIIQVFNYL
jgi:hypothetical protein